MIELSAYFSFLTFVKQRYFKRIRRSLYLIPAERRSAGTLALSFIINSITKKRINKAYDFNY